MLQAVARQCRLQQRKSVSAHCNRLLVFSSKWRCHSSSSTGRDARNVHHERVDVPCRANGSISLDIYRPPSPPSATKHQTILLYLPHEPCFCEDEHEHNGANFAPLYSSTCQSTVIKLNYRLTPSRLFPLPIHDVLTGYDWIVKHARDLVQSDESGQGIGIGTCGELVGGTLATMLAMTECRAEDETRVVSCWVKEPVVDWVGLEGIAETGPRAKTLKSKARQLDAASADAGPTTNALLSLRRRIFRPDRPSSYFDPFASPLLFLRSPGAAVPPIPIAGAPSNASGENDWTALSGLEELSLREDGSERVQVVDPQAVQDLLQRPTESAAATAAASVAATTNNSDTAGLPKPRRMPKPYPLRGNPPLDFPRFKFVVGQRSALRGQIEEMVRLLRRNLVKYGDAGIRGTSGVKEELLVEREEDDGEESGEVGAARRAADERFEIDLCDYEQRLEQEHMPNGSMDLDSTYFRAEDAAKLASWFVGDAYR